MSGPEVLAVVVLVGMGGVALQGVVTLFRRHSLDARRPGPLVERLGRREHADRPARLAELDAEVAQVLAGPASALRSVQAHLSELAAQAPRPVEVEAPPGGRRAAWLSAQLARLETAYRIDRPGPSPPPGGTPPP